MNYRNKKDKNLDLNTISGSGPNGRIIAKDVETAQPQEVSSVAAPSFPSFGSDGSEFEDVKNSTMRNVIAKRLLESSNGAPEFFLTPEMPQGTTNLVLPGCCTGPTS